MEKAYYTGNRQRLYAMLEPGSLLLLFSGRELRKSADAVYPFHADRNFLYLTGIRQKESVLLVQKDAAGTVTEQLYLLSKDLMAERWTGRRLCAEEAREISGIDRICSTADLTARFHALTVTGKFCRVYLDLHRQAPEDPDREAHLFARHLRDTYPQLALPNVNPFLRKLRTIKQPCEIEALRKAEAITGEGILAMMTASRPGMWEYQYKAEFDRVLGRYSPREAGFQSIISAGDNNFCIHYDAYTGQARDGDMVLNDVGAQWEDLTVDVSRGWPCNGKFTEKQKLLYECALKTSDYLFSIIRPGMKMAEVDATVRRYNAALLVEAGVMETEEEVGTYMWHGGAHHIGYDVHDSVEMPELLAPGMVFCVDVGIYHEAWGIGFRLEDNCLVTEDGCENLSAAIPRTVEQIEAVMAK